MNIEVIYEDDNFLALNKPAGVLVHGDGKSDKKTLTSWLLEKYPEVKDVGDKPEERPGIVHRLDKDTSGIILVPRNQEYFLYLKDLFKTRQINKTYRAIVHGEIKEEEGVIDVPISLKPGSVKRTTYKGKLTKEAVTEYKVLEKFKDYTYLEVFPKTGRTHQIRVHLLSIHNSIVGDKLYGGKINKGLGVRQMLHAYEIEFDISPGKTIKLKADLPNDFKDFLSTLEK